MNDLTFDNRGFSLGRHVLGVAGVLIFMIVCLPLFVIGNGLGGIVLIPLLVFVIWKIRAHRHARTLKRQPTTDIERLSNGYFEISGAAQCADHRELRDPIQNQPCVWFGVETLRHEEGKIRMWLPFKRASSSRIFAVRDATGVCLVDPRGAELIVEDCVEVMVNDDVKHRIWRICAGDVLTVVGEATRSERGQHIRRPAGWKRYLIAGEGAA